MGPVSETTTPPPEEDTPPITRFGVPTPPEEVSCPEDIFLKRYNNEYVLDTHNDSSSMIRIISQDTTSVTVEFTQSYTPPSSSIDHIFYQYKKDNLDTNCNEVSNVTGGTTFEVTLTCMVTSSFALLEVWIADDIEKGVLTADDNVTIPQCCHPDDVPKSTPVSKYLWEIS